MSSLLPLLWRGDSAEIAHKYMDNNPILITNFNGQAENPHIGAGVNVGVDLYTTKNVARLSRKMEDKTDGIIDSMPLYSTRDNFGVVYVQCYNGKIFRSTNDGTTWTLLSGNTGTDGRGLTVWQDYLWAFTPTGVDLYGPLSGAVTWTNNWVGFTGGEALIGAVSVNHFPLSTPGISAQLLITNRNYIAQVIIAAGTVFDPLTPATYQARARQFVMQGYYNAKVIGFLPPNQIDIGVENILNPSQADVVIWDGVSTDKATNIFTIPGATGPVVNLLTRNGISYAITTNEAGIYTVNGSSSQVVDRLGLRMTNRLPSGEQYTTRVQPTINVGSSDFLGPELLVGTSNYPNNFTQVSGTGLYPYGVWSVDVEAKNVYTKYPLSHGDINANYNTDYEIGFIKVITDGKVLVGWRKGNNYGIDTLNANNYISNASTVFIESELYEVGTRINPETFSNILYNLVEPLKTDEEINFYYRLSQADPYVLFWTDTAATLGNNLGGIITPLPFQQAKYIQIGISIKTGSGTPLETPQLVSVYLNK